MAELAAAAAVAQVVGSVMEFQASKSTAKSVKIAGDYNARVAEAQAIQEEAISQVGAKEKAKESAIVQSRALALSAAGGGASDVGVQNIIGDIAGQGEINRLTTLFEGSERAAGLRQGADLSRFEANVRAKQIKRKGKIDLLGGLAGAAGSASKIDFGSGSKTKPTPTRKPTSHLSSNSLFSKYNTGSFR